MPVGTEKTPQNPVSVVILARNEETLLGDCLESVAHWADELVVVDMESTDATVAIAQARGALVVSHPLIPNFDLARSPGIRAAKHDWILVLDADERPTPGLLDQLTDVLQSEQADVVEVPRANLALSGFAPHEAGFPEYKLRLFRRTHINLDTYTGAIHTFYQPLPGARPWVVPGVYPRCCLIHLTNPALVPFWDKINLYTSEEARSRYPKVGAVRPWHLWQPLKVFLRRYLKHGGWKDGWRGFWLCWISGVYEGLVWAKLWEMGLHNGEIPDAKMARAQMQKSLENVG